MVEHCKRRLKGRKSGFFADAERAIKQAQKIVSFVIKKVSEPTTGQTSLLTGYNRGKN